VHFGIGKFRWCITAKATLSGVSNMLSICWLQQQPCHAFDDVSTAVFERVLVIAIPIHILESVYFPLPESQIIWHGSHERLDAISVFEVCETQRSVFFLQHLVIVRLHALLLDPTVDIFVLFTRHKCRVWVDL
jgi:hypothetical protein